MLLKICRDPAKNWKPIKICDRDENSTVPKKMPCCMCTGIEVIETDKLKHWIDELKISGKGTKQTVLEEMEEVLYGKPRKKKSPQM